MCGRANLVAVGPELEELFGLEEPVEGLEPRYNIAPSQPLLAVRQLAGAPRVARPLTWGLVRATDKPGAKAPINLRVESAARGALLGNLRDRRCIIPMSGFYEWRRTGRLSQPYNIRRHDLQPFGVAGVWSRVERDDQPALDTCLVLTMAANRVVEPIHTRMPLILEAESYDAWLDPSRHEAQELLERIRPLDPDALEAYTVSARVNSAAQDDAACLEPIRAASLW